MERVWPETMSQWLCFILHKHSYLCIYYILVPYICILLMPVHWMMFIDECRSTITDARAHFSVIVLECVNVCVRRTCESVPRNSIERFQLINIILLCLNFDRSQTRGLVVINAKRVAQRELNWSLLLNVYMAKALLFLWRILCKQDKCN